MANYLTIARPYARALFSEAVEQSTLSDWQTVLNTLSVVVAVLSQHHFIGNPAISNDTIETLCCDTLKDTVTLSSNIMNSAHRFIQLVLAEKRLIIIPEIAALYHQMLTQHQKTVEVDVFFATVLTVAQQDALMISLKKRFNLNVTIQYIHDPSLIGGLIVKSDSWVFDGSIRTNLARLSNMIA